MTAPTPPDYSQWKYRARIRITNPAAVANYQHLLTLTWKPGMRSDFRDVRFTEQDGTNCPYWIESKTDRSSAKVWIKVPSASQGLIFLYYGNGAAVSESNGDDTFDFFDDFPGSAIDTDKWEGDTASAAVSSGVMTFKCDSGSYKVLRSKTSYGPGAVLEAYMKPYHTSGADFYGFSNAGVTEAIFWYRNSTDNLLYSIEGSSVGSAATNFTTATTYRTIKIAFESATQARFFEGGVERTNSPRTTKIPDGAIPIMMRSLSTTTGWVTDWIFIRKYVATAPTLAAYFTGVSPRLPHQGVHGLTLSAGTEYAFDPVNVDHGMVAGYGGQEIIQTTNVNHSMTPGAGAQDVECGAVNIYHPIYPTASWAQIIDPVVDSGYLIGVTVSQSMDDAMAEAVFEYDGNEIGNYFSGDYMTQVHVTIPDYLGVSNCVFVGIIPSSHAVYDVARDKMTMRAVDYGLFLSKQTLDIKDLSILPPGDQTSEGANIAKTLSCDNITRPFQLGQTIKGATSGASGTIVDIAAAHILWLYPATGNFVDDEIIQVGGVDVAYADGRSVNTSYTPYYATTSPEDWVRSILGGNNWMRVAGIEPTEIESSAGYWDTADCPAVAFMFSSLEKKRDALKRVAAYMSYMWHVKPRSIGTGIYTQAGYFIKQTSIDSLLALPAAATIAGPDDFAGPITLDQDGELQVDVVKVRCQGLKGTWLPEEIRSNSFYDAGEGPYREFRDEPKDICTQTDLAAYATDMYNLYSARTRSWSGTLVARADLQLYQLLTISGMGTEVPDGTYRITKITHEYGCAKNLTHITFMLSTSFSILRKYGMTYKDSISKVQQIAEGLENRKPQTELATVTATDGWTITYGTEAGNTGMGRDSTSTPLVAGTVPVGAKVSVQTMRGGVVCIPLTSGPAAGTDVSVVDVPTYAQAITYEVDPAWYILLWKPGANNDNVRIDISTSGYSATPGDGAMTHLFPISTTDARVAFIERNTVHYISLWGVKGGRFSTTAKQITITSAEDLYVDPDIIPIEPPLSYGEIWYGESITGGEHHGTGEDSYIFLRNLGDTGTVTTTKNFSAIAISTYQSDANDGTIDILVGGAKYLTVDTHEMGTDTISIDFGTTWAAGTVITIRTPTSADAHIWYIKTW